MVTKTSVSNWDFDRPSLQPAASVLISGISDTVWTYLGKFVRGELFTLSFILLLRMICCVDLLELILAIPQLDI